jgi:hypothetical protein
MGSQVDTVEIAERLDCCAHALDETDRHAQLGPFRLLAAGDPVDPNRLAAHEGLETGDVLARAGCRHGVPRDDHGHIVAFQGLSIVEAPHRLRIYGRTLYAWCARTPSCCPS